MHSRLALVDAVIIAAYIVGTTLLGFWFARGQRGLTTYFVGDRNVSWWLVLVSIVATETSAVTILSIPGVAYGAGGNLAFLQLALGFVIGRMLIAWFLLPQYFRGELFSAYQLLRERFNPAVQRVASGLFLATRAVADGLRLYLAALLLGQLTGWDIYVAVLAMGGVTIVYTYLGGMQAIIWTDLIQFAIYITGAFIAASVLLGDLSGGLDEFVRIGRDSGKFELFDLSTDPTRAYTLWAGLIGGAFITMASHGADQLMVQRYFCARGLSEARRALIVSGVVVLAQFALFLLIGVGLYAAAQQGQLPVKPETKGDEVFGLFIVTRLPQGLIGVLLAAVMASAMSSLSSSLNSSATAFVADFYRPLRPGRPEEAYLRISKVMTGVWGLTRIGVALVAAWLNSGESIVKQVLTIAAMTTGLILGLFLLGSLRRVVSSTAALIGLVTGFVVVFGVWLPGNWRREPLLAYPWFAPLGAGVTVAIAWFVEWARGLHGSPADRSAQSGLDAPR
jgi:SSS family transporter